MAVLEQYASDVEAILSHKYDNGGDLWTTSDNRLMKGAPFSTLECVLYLLELGVLESKMVDGQIVVERIIPKLAGLNFCKKGEKSALATMRYHEILQNLNIKR